MSSDPTWKRDANGVAHPTHETLLAFIREQCSEHEKSSINEHLLTGCAPCNRLHADLTQPGNALNHLKHMSRYLYYPELQSNQVLLHAQRGEPLTSVWTGKRKRKFQAQSRPLTARRYAHKRSVRIVSLPAAFAILLLFMTAVVLAYTVVHSGLQITSSGQQSVRFTTSVPNPTGVAPHKTPPTSVTITPPTTIIKGAGLDACPEAQYAGPLIIICGSGFKAGDKVWLEVDYNGSNSHKTLGPYTVNKNGGFKAYLSITCKNLPVTVNAADKMHQPLTVPVTGISRDGCNAR
jgi:hypothetical protein